MFSIIKAKFNESLNNSIIIRLAVIAIIFYFIFSFIYSYFEFKMGVYVMNMGGLLQLFFTGLFIFSIISHRTTALLGLFSTYLILVIDVYYSGGFFSHSLPWVVLIPIYARLLLESNPIKVFCLIITALTILFFGYVQFLGITLPNPFVSSKTEITAISFLGMAIMAIIVADLFERKKEYVLQQLLNKELKLKESEELRKAKNNIKLIEERWKLSVEASNDAIMLLNEKGFFDCNDETLKMFKIPSVQVLKQIHPSDISPDFQEDGSSSIVKSKEMIQIALDKGINRFEWVHKKYNGELFTAEVSLSRFKMGEDFAVQAIVRNIEDAKIANLKLKQSESKYRSIIENSPDVIILTDINEKIELINNDTNEKHNGKSIYELVDKKYHDEIRKCNNLVLTGQVRYSSYETEKDHHTGIKKFYFTKVGPKVIDNKISGLVLFISDTTSKKLAEKKVIKSLHEKEVLLKEVHHRVKNNLQIISSILNLQSSTIEDQKILEILKNSQDRIRSMSLIHELLYQRKDFSTISFAEYIQSITTNLFHSYNQNNNVKLDLQLSEINLDLDLSIPCGLIINELVTNSLKYAFEKKQEGRITIKLFIEDYKVFLIISDNGKGFPQDLDYRKTTSLGMQLVVALVDQLGGQIELDKQNGTTFKVIFEIPQKK